MRLQSMLISLVTVCTIALAIIVQETMLWFITGCLSIISVHLILIATQAKRAFTLRVSVGQASYVAGDEATITLHLVKRSILPLFWLAITQTWCNETNGQNYTFRKLLIPLFRHSFTISYRLHRLKRGEYDTAGIEVMFGDVFGLAYKAIQLELFSQFIVYPRLLSMMPQFEMMLHEQAKLHLQHTASFNSIRDYIAGDPLNRIDWKSSARSNGLKTKESEASERRNIIVMLDGDAQAPFLFEKCVQVTASLLKCALQLRRAVQFNCSNEQRSQIDVPARQHMGQVLAMLATIRADGKAGLHTVLQERVWQHKSRDIVICVTANLSDQLLTALTAMRTEHIAIVLFFVHGHAELTWQQQHLKQQLQAIGCTFYPVPHVPFIDDDGVISDVG